MTNIIATTAHMVCAISEATIMIFLILNECINMKYFTGDRTKVNTMGCSMDS